MKLSDIWYEYEKNPTDVEIAKLLQQKIQMLAKVVLNDFRINNHVVSYEDLLQQAYLCFFDFVVPQYDPERGSLEGLFMTSFRHHVIYIFRDLVRSAICADVIDDTPNALEILLAIEFDKEVRSLLDDSEQKLYEYLVTGNFDFKEIAQEEGTDEKTVRDIATSITNKVYKLLDSKYNYYGTRGLND